MVRSSKVPPGSPKPQRSGFDINFLWFGRSPDQQHLVFQNQTFRTRKAPVPSGRRYSFFPCGSEATHYAEEKTGGLKAKKAKTSSIVIGRKESLGMNVFACHVQSIKSNRNLQITWRVRRASKSKANRDTRGLGRTGSPSDLRGAQDGAGHRPKSASKKLEAQYLSKRWALESLPTRSDVVATEASARAVQGFSKRCALARPTEA